MPLFLGDGPLPVDEVLTLLPKLTAIFSRLARAASFTSLPFTIRWDRFDLTVGETTVFAFDGLRITGDLLSGATIGGDIRLVFKDGAFQTDGSYIRRFTSDSTRTIPLIPLKLASVDNGFALTWSEPNVNDWLVSVFPNLHDESPLTNVDMTLQVIFGGDGEKLIKEIRLDWRPDQDRQLVLPGLKVALPAHTLHSLILYSTPNQSVRLMLCATLQETITASSVFAWEREDERELHNDEPQPAKPLFVATLKPGESTSVVLLDVALGTAQLPRFFRQLAEPIEALNLDDGHTLGNPLDLTTEDLSGWSGTLAVNLDEFKLPFLKQGNGDSAQFIELFRPPDPSDPSHPLDMSSLPIALPSGEVTFGVGVRLKIASLSFEGNCTFTFSLKTFALKVDHNLGIELVSTKPSLDSQSLFGMQWRFKGEDIGNGRFHYFTIATKNYHYQIQQPADASLEIDFTRASEEPITFSVRDFALTPKGINLVATVTDRPARLNGVNTRFRFTDSGFVIRENRIADFTIAGSGPLPPDLVGDATADIALQFAQQSDGNLTLVQGSANLRGSKLLECKGTRFQFSLDALGLRFVDDGRFHLYFTLTGSAQFAPAPGDDLDGPLALLGKIKIDLVQCPLTGDARIIAKHVKFLIELPKPKSFNFLGCFEMELRAIGFVPQCDFFEGDGAMQVTGQLKFAQGAGDTPDSRPDYHQLFIGLPRPGEFVPRIHFTRLAVNLALGSAFRLSGVVDFIDEPDQTGLLGEGLVEIQGLPTIAASFGFLRVRRDAASPWLRAWFIYLEIRQVSFMIPVIQIYLREVGLGFGYRFTISSIKAADAEHDVRKLLKTLQALSRTQGDLSKRDRWAVDLEGPGQDPRWTIVLRAMISQTSASPSPLRWEPVSEKELACVFLLDAIIAFRSDLTFFMAIRGWFNTNYADFVNNVEGAREKPIASGFVLLSPRQKRFLANVIKPEGGKPGTHPPLPDFVRDAIGNSRFSATLLIEPGLFHMELGWPNMLRWHAELGPLKAEFQGGFIFRVSTTEMVIGTSFLARGTLDISAGLDLGLVGVRISAQARVAYGTRYIGVVDFVAPRDNSALYGAIGLEVQIHFAIEFWIKIPLVFKTIKLSYSFSLEILFTASLEAGIKGLSLPGIRGTGTVGVSCCGHSLQVTVKIGLNEDAVAAAQLRTQEFLSLGLEATDVEPVPGTQEAILSLDAAPRFMRALEQPRGVLPPRALGALLRPEVMVLGEVDSFHVPGYVIFVLREPPVWDAEQRIYFVILPQAEQLQHDAQGNLELDEDSYPIHTIEQGFLPPPPNGNVEADFAIHFPKPLADEHYRLFHFQPLGANDFKEVTDDVVNDRQIRWSVHWDAQLFGPQNEAGNTVTQRTIDPATLQPTESAAITLSLREHLATAFKQSYGGEGPSAVITLLGDPDALPGLRPPIDDPRVQNPSDSSFETAVRGAFEQFAGSPFFKHDSDALYEQLLKDAFDTGTTIYTKEGKVKASAPETVTRDQMNQQAHQMRGLIIHDIVADLRTFHGTLSQRERAALIDRSIAFQMGLVFAVKGQNNLRPAWLDQVTVDTTTLPTISQRETPEATAPGATSAMIRTFNVIQTDFTAFPPQFDQVRQYTDAGTIALTWNLNWRRERVAGLSRAQDDPHHHLAHYQVRRRALDGREVERVSTVKPAPVLHRHDTQVDDPNNPGETIDADTLSLLQPRFQIVDHFTNETADDLAALPPEGRSYVYTITPIDFANNTGRPLTLVATRYPNTPPPVPVDGDLTVSYRVSPADTEPRGDAATPQVLTPRQVFIEWTEAATQGGQQVAIKTYRLIFRRESTVPIGSYGLDSTTQRGRTAGLPTSNARPLPTDIAIDLSSPFGPRSERGAVIPVKTLRDAGILPQDDWRPEAWRVFFQTISINNVPSALAPVQLRLAVEAVSTPQTDAAPMDRIETALPQREERRPAELEWLPLPTSFAVVQPEDEHAQTGDAHFPMPLMKSVADTSGKPQLLPPQFNGQLGTMIGFLRHPSGIRAIRFRWNQGPSANPAYPLSMNAGYQLYELNIDATTTDIFVDAKRLADEMRLLQDVQMLPANDLALTPGDTLNTSQWEAWYPSAMQRHKPPAQRAPGSQIARGPWYSWQESYLVWPEWSGVTQAGGKRTSAMHPFLAQLIEALRAKRKGSRRDNKNNLVGGYNVALQVSPPTLPNDRDDFLDSCPPGTDPYGWGVLQRLGLTATFTLHDPDRGDVLQGQPLLDAIQSVLNQIALDPKADTLIRDHLHVELLFQPGQSVQLQEQSADTKALLALVQFSLRPKVRQRLRYAQLTFEGPARTELTLLFTFPPQPGAQCSVINQHDPAAGQTELEPSPEPIKRTITLSLNGQATILLRGSDPLPTAGLLVTLANDATDAAALATLSSKLTYQSANTQPNTPAQIVIFQPLDATERELVHNALSPADKGLADTLAYLRQQGTFDATDEHSTYFTVATGALAQRFAQPGEPEGEQWLRLKYYIETLNSNDPKVPATSKVTVPTTEAEILKILPGMLSWLVRFFDASGAIPAPIPGALAETNPGPWVATAYPRSGTPAVTAPDTGGRLTYTHLLEDKWAHTFRFYFQPYGRYDLLWESLRRSPTLFPNLTLSDVDAPVMVVDPNAGGLDVVVERTQPIDAPLILRSQRLDEPATPARPPAPGRTWEVIIAQHHEQTLAERNQTLARQLAFRQLAFTLLRRFGYASWYYWLRSFTIDTERDLPIGLIEDQYPSIPDSYPPHPDHIDLDTTALDLDEVRSLDLPERVGVFSQGVLALQWQALPFYYEHRLLVIAQTDSTVSPITSVTQRDLTYRSPLPQAWVTGRDVAWPVASPVTLDDSIPLGDHVLAIDEASVSTVRARGLTIPLRRFWDSLPEDAQDQWSIEAPDATNAAAPARKLSALPDPEVVYQIVELFSGNVEVQAECFYDQDTSGFAFRQLGKHFLATALQLLPPPGVLDDFPLLVALLQVTEEELTQAYASATLPNATASKVTFTAPTHFAFTGVMTSDDRDALQRLFNEQDNRKLQQIYDNWYNQEPVSALVQLSDALRGSVDFVPTNTLYLAWEGASDTALVALQSLSGDSAFTTAIADLAARAKNAAAGAITRVELPGGPDQVPDGLVGKIGIESAADMAHYAALTWPGSMSDDDAAALRRWAQFSAFAEAVEALITAVKNYTLSFDLLPEPRRPSQEQVLPELQQALRVQPIALVYEGPKANASQLAALQDLASQGDQPFQQAVQAIIDANTAAPDGTNVSKTVALPTEPRRPTNDMLSPILRQQFVIEPLKLTWKGYPATDEQIAQLQTLVSQGDLSFRTAVQQLLAQLKLPVRVDFTVPVRPKQHDLPDGLAARLLLGRALMRYHGIMSSEEGHQLFQLYPALPDQRAIGRLHDVSQRSGMRGRSLMIRARRGSAAPSEMRPLEPELL